MSPRWKINYKEGDWCIVPLQDGGHALGLIARAYRGHTFGYFFPLPGGELSPSITTLMRLTPSDAVFMGMFGALGLLNGDWRVIGHSKPWKREMWPIPAFGRIDCINPRIAMRIEYDDRDPSEEIRAVRCTPEDVWDLPDDGVHGYVSLQKVMTHILRGYPAPTAGCPTPWLKAPAEAHPEEAKSSR